MFGDPLTNPKQLSIRKVEDVVAKFEGGKNIQAGDGEASNLRILKVSAVTSGTYVESECKPAPNDYVPPTQHFVRVGDMLFSRANTSELVGATALVEHTNGSTLLPDKLWRFVWKEEVVPSYMWALFQSKAVRQQLSNSASWHLAQATPCATSRRPSCSSSICQLPSLKTSADLASSSTRQDRFKPNSKQH